jgi:predicted RNase H-like nuclease (RuvC/YqgF family)
LDLDKGSRIGRSQQSLEIKNESKRLEKLINGQERELSVIKPKVSDIKQKINVEKQKLLNLNIKIQKINAQKQELRNNKSNAAS